MSDLHIRNTQLQCANHDTNKKLFQILLNIHPQMRNKNMVAELISSIVKEPILNIECQTTAYSNYVYMVQTPSAKYIYKEYVNIDDIVLHDVEVFIQSQVGFPEIVACDKKYRIEKYIEHTMPKWDDDLEEIASALKNFHCRVIECDLTQADMLNKMIFKNKDLMVDAITPRIYGMVLKCIECDLSTICHNDLQVGNMMMIGGEISFIDFEYACRGNPRVDIANLFCETRCNYDIDYVINRERGYTNEQKERFLQIYFGKTDVTVELEEIRNCEAFSHFYWFLWSRYFYMNKNGPSESFTYGEYSLSRLHALIDLDIITKEEYYYFKDKYM